MSTGESSDGLTEELVAGTPQSEYVRIYYRVGSIYGRGEGGLSGAVFER